MNLRHWSLKSLVLLLFAQVASSEQSKESQILGWALGKCLDILVVASPEQRYLLLSGAARAIGTLQCLDAWRSAKERYETTSEDRWRLSLHEAGHALALILKESRTSFDDDYLGKFAKNGDPPRFELKGVKLHLGASSLQPAGSTPFRFRRKAVVFEGKDIDQMLHLTLSGRAAEEAVLGRGSAGAGGDFQLAMNLAETYVQLSFGKHFDIAVPQRELQKRARRHLKKAHADAVAFAKKYKFELTHLARALFVKEYLSAGEARAIVNECRHHQKILPRFLSFSSSSTAVVPHQDPSPPTRLAVSRLFWGKRRESPSDYETTLSRCQRSVFSFPDDNRRSPEVHKVRFAIYEAVHFLNNFLQRCYIWSSIADALQSKANKARETRRLKVIEQQKKIPRWQRALFGIKVPQTSTSLKAIL